MAMLTTTRNVLKYLGDDAAVDTWLTYRNGYADAFQLIDAAIAKCNFASSVDPTTGDDSGDGYTTGSRWHNTTLNKIFVCVDATLGSAVWLQEFSNPAAATYAIQIPHPAEDDYTKGIRIGSYLGLFQAYYVGYTFITWNSHLTSSSTTNKFTPYYNPGYGFVLAGNFANQLALYGYFWDSSSVEKELSDMTACLTINYTGDLWVAGNMSALTFTDRTPAYEGDALGAIKKIKGKDGKIDHTSLPAFARKTITKKSESGEEIQKEGRDLGAMISILTVAVQQLTERLEKLEKVSTKG